MAAASFWRLTASSTIRCPYLHITHSSHSLALNSMNAHQVSIGGGGGGAGSSKTKNTVYVSGFAPEVNEQQLLDAFVTFGDILEISIPTEPNEPSKHRGFAFLTFSNPADAQEAIDNFDLNELPGYQGRGRYLKCSVAQPDKFGKEGKGGFDRAVWHSEDWIKQHGSSDQPTGAGAASGETGEAQE